MTEINGDSDEYWFLTEAVELTKDIYGMCLEIGLRLGMGTKTLIDAVREYSPDKLVISVDPFGNMPYTGREHVGETHYDYTNDMRNECMLNIWQYINENPVDYRFFNLTDYHFFELFKNGVPVYGYDGSVINEKYAVIHLDGPHTVKDVVFELKFFEKRTDKGAIVCIDDFSEDFIQVEPLREYLEKKWEHIKTGGKKTLWRKK